MRKRGQRRNPAPPHPIADPRLRRNARGLYRALGPIHGPRSRARFGRNRLRLPRKDFGRSTRQDPFASNRPIGGRSDCNLTDLSGVVHRDYLRPLGRSIRDRSSRLVPTDKADTSSVPRALRTMSNSAGATKRQKSIANHSQKKARQHWRGNENVALCLFFGPP